MTAHDAARPRVLVVDDEEPVREAVADFLLDEGFEVVTAASGREALTLARASAFALYILDLRMPGMSGNELAVALRAISPATPFLVITGSPDYVPGEPLRALGVGADDTLIKPYDLLLLGEKVRRRIGAAT